MQIPLGEFPGMSVEQAQKRVKLCWNGIADGHDPRSDRRTRREEPLVYLWEYWLTHAKERKRGRKMNGSTMLLEAVGEPEAIGRQEVRCSSPPRQDGREKRPYAANRMYP